MTASTTFRSVLLALIFFLASVLSDRALAFWSFANGTAVYVQVEKTGVYENPGDDQPVKVWIESRQKVMVEDKASQDGVWYLVGVAGTGRTARSRGMSRNPCWTRGASSTWRQESGLCQKTALID